MFPILEWDIDPVTNLICEGRNLWAARGLAQKPQTGANAGISAVQASLLAACRIDESTQTFLWGLPANVRLKIRFPIN